jgi:hypothetical protein
MQSAIPFNAIRLACSFEDSIFERMFASRLLGRNTFAMYNHLDTVVCLAIIKF